MSKDTGEALEDETEQRVIHVFSFHIVHDKDKQNTVKLKLFDVENLLTSFNKISL